jgi:hypothetical protein
MPQERAYAVVVGKLESLAGSVGGVESELPKPVLDDYCRAKAERVAPPGSTVSSAAAWSTVRW